MSTNGNSEVKWKRPDTVNLPTVWRKFDGIRKMGDGRIPKFRIQDVTEDMHDDVVLFMKTHFLRDEVLCECLKILEDPVSVNELVDVWKMLLKQNMALVAFEEDGSGKTERRIAGANVTGISYKTEHFSADMFQGRAMKILVRDILEHASSIFDIFENYGVDEYMTALGLCVDPVYRGQGLGLEILKARFDLGSAVGLQVTMTAFTGPASQALAHRAGMTVLAEVNYEDYKEDDGTPVYPNVKSKGCKIMASIFK